MDISQLQDDVDWAKGMLERLPSYADIGVSHNHCVSTLTLFVMQGEKYIQRNIVSADPEPYPDAPV